MGGCLSSSSGGGSADTALAVKGQAYHATAQSSTSQVVEEQKQQGPSKQQEDDNQRRQQLGATTRGHDSSASCPDTDGPPIQNNLLHKVMAESSPSTPVTQPGSARSPDLQPRPSSTNLSTEQAARARQKSSVSELHAFQQQAAPDARHVEEQPASSISSEKSAAAAAKKPKSLKSRLLAAANLESIDREAEPTTSQQQSTADAPTASSPFATPPNSRTPFGGSAGTGAGYPSSRCSSRTLSAAAGLNPAAAAAGVRPISSRAMTLQNAAAGPGAASTLMSQVETRLIEAEQLLGQQRSVKQGNSESSLTKPPEVNRPPTREEMMLQLDLAEKKLMDMRRKEGGSGYA